MSINLIVTRGYSTGMLTGSISDIALKGYGSTDDGTLWTFNENSDGVWVEQVDKTDNWVVS